MDVIHSILVVEDEMVVAMDLGNRLRKLGFDVCDVVPSGGEALLAVEQSSPDLVLMDIMLKGDMDGIEAAREIKARLKIPVLYLTAYTDDETLERAKMTEPAGYISKPFKEEDLHSNIEMALHKHKAEKKEIESDSDE